MRRRAFISLLCGAAAWPIAATAQQRDRMRRIGVLNGLDENDPQAKLQFFAFTQALAGLGWTDGRNVRIDFRWAGGDTDRMRMLAQELVDLQPDIILATSTISTAAFQRETRMIPIVFVNVSDPVASGIVARLDRPSGNITGFANFEATWEASGLSCSRRSRPGSSGRQSCSIRTTPAHPFMCPHLRRQLGHSRSCRSLRPFIAT
jgi:putative ABC transport system substrate-binding protein